MHLHCTCTYLAVDATFLLLHITMVALTSIGCKCWLGSVPSNLGCVAKLLDSTTVAYKSFYLVSVHPDMPRYVRVDDEARD